MTSIINMENEQFLSLMWDRDARQFLLNYGGFNWMDAYVPCYRYFGHQKRIKYGLFNFLGIKKYKGTPEHYKGYIGLDEPYNAHHEWFNTYFIQPIDQPVVSMLEDFLGDCKKNGIEVLLVLPPIAYELSDKVENEEEIYHIYDSLAQSYQFNCIRYVAPHWMSMDTNNFESPNHLNNKMSDTYSLDLAHYISEQYQDLFNSKNQ